MFSQAESQVSQRYLEDTVMKLCIYPLAQLQNVSNDQFGGLGLASATLSTDDTHLRHTSAAVEMHSMVPGFFQLVSRL